MAYELFDACVYQGFELRIGNKRKGKIKDFDAGWPYGRKVSVEEDQMKNSYLT